MKTNPRLIIGIVVGLIIASFFLGRCSRIRPIQEIEMPVIVPAKSGEFKSPDILVPIETKEVTKILYKDSIMYVPTVNQDLVDAYIKTLEENDKLKSLNLYTDAIKINKYETVFDNKDLKLTVKSTVEGKLLELSPEYTIKEQNIIVPIKIPEPKKQVFAMNVGAVINTTKDLSKIDPAVQLQLVNKKGSILSASYSIDGVVSVGYSIPLFSIKK